MVIFDTNIIIDHIRKKREQMSYLENFQYKSNLSTGLSIISIQELYEGKSLNNKQNEHILLRILEPFTILPYNFKVAKLAGELAREIKTPTDFPDIAIAATAIINDCELFTLNQKDFKGIPNLKLFQLSD